MTSIKHTNTIENIGIYVTYLVLSKTEQTGKTLVTRLTLFFISHILLNYKFGIHIALMYSMYMPLRILPLKNFTIIVNRTIYKTASRRFPFQSRRHDEQ